MIAKRFLLHIYLHSVFIPITFSSETLMYNFVLSLKPMNNIIDFLMYNQESGYLIEFWSRSYASE